MHKRGLWVAVGLLCLTTGVAVSDDARWSGSDFGLFRDQQLRDHARQLFGVKHPLQASSTKSVDARTAEADPTSLT